MIAGNLKPDSLFRLVCRPALPKDTPEVMELTRTIWDGEDYVPDVWIDWFSDPQGLLAIAEFGGRVVGLGKLTRLSQADWWLEGLRVQPNYEGRGIASHLHDYLLDYWLRNGTGTIRLVTASFRLPIHRICERTGFQKVAEFTPFIAQPIEPISGRDEQSRFTLIDTSQIDEVSGFIIDNPRLSWTAGLMDLGWQWATPTDDHIRHAVGQEQAYWWQDHRGVLVISEDDERSLRTSMIRLIACQKETILEILLDYRQLARRLGFQQAGWIAPLEPEIESLLVKAGFQRDWDASLYIFEKHHP